MDTLEALSPIEAISSYEINQRKNQLPETHEAYDKDNKHSDYSCKECYKISIILVKHQIESHRTNDEVQRRNLFQTLKDIENKMLFSEKYQSDLQYLDNEILMNVESRNRLKTEFGVNYDTSKRSKNFDQQLAKPASMQQHYSIIDKNMLFLDNAPKHKIEDDNLSDQSSLCGQDFESVYLHEAEPSLKTLTLQSKDKKPKLRYKCDICLREYLKKKTLRDHMNTHSGDKVTGRRHHYRTHHSSNGPQINPATAASPLSASLLCDNCGRSFSTKSSLINHMKTHRNGTETTVKPDSKHTNIGLNSLACNTCDRLYSTRKGLMSHIRVHASNRPVFKCELCDRQYFEKRSLREHMTVHSQLKSFECVYGCGKAFAHKSSRRHHHKSYHQSTKIGIENGGDASECVLCDFCGREFNSKKRLLVHLRIHNAERPLYKCADCGKEFFKKQSLRDHTNIHTGRTPYKCLFGCGKGFANISLRRYHERGFHKPKEEFKCELCSKILQHKNTFVAHMRTHTGNYVYECKLCNNKYPTKSSLNNHHATKHSIERPFKCERCLMGFTTKFKMSKHLKRKTLCSIDEQQKRADFQDKIKAVGLIYACDLCDKSYYIKKSLGKHRRLKHKDRKPYKCERCHMIFAYKHRLDCHLNRKKICDIVEPSLVEWTMQEKN